MSVAKPQRSYFEMTTTQQQKIQLLSRNFFVQYCTLCVTVRHQVRNDPFVVDKFRTPPQLALVRCLKQTENVKETK